MSGLTAHSPPLAAETTRQRQALGVDQLDRAGLRRSAVRQGQRHRAARLVEGGGRRQRAGRQQLEVVELPRRGAVLGHGGGRHGGHPAIGALASLAAMSAPVVAEIVRSGFVEGHHYGSVVALDADGARGLVGRAGRRADPAAVLQQAAPGRSAMVRLGLDLPPDLLALACASHSGEPFHVEGVRRILAAAGLDESALQTPPDYPLDDAAREEVIRDGGGQGADPDELLGQARRDAGHLRRQRLGHRDLPATPTTRCSRRSRETFAELTGEPVERVAVDGCGAPLLSTSLTGLARAFRRLALGLDGADRPDPRRPGWRTRSAPTRRTSRGRRATSCALLTAIPGAIGKAGAESCYAVALPDGACVRAEDRRRRAAGAAGADGRGAAPLRRRRRGRASTPRPSTRPGVVPLLGGGRAGGRDPRRLLSLLAVRMLRRTQ